jgi:peroxiredoxin
VLQYSQTGNISLDLSGTYRYLDSEKKVFSSGTLASLLNEHRYTIVYFYPKDGTPNCTIQALDFSLMKEEFAKLGYGII